MRLGSTRWRTSSPRTASHPHPDLRSPTWRCISRTAAWLITRVVPARRSTGGRSWVAVLHVRHVDVDHPVQQRQRLRARRSRRCCRPAAGAARHCAAISSAARIGGMTWLGADQVDVVAAGSPAAPGRWRASSSGSSSLAAGRAWLISTVLAVNAAQVAAREKDRARAARAAQRTFLAGVRRRNWPPARVRPCGTRPASRPAG